MTGWKRCRNSKTPIDWPKKPARFVQLSWKTRSGQEAPSVSCLLISNRIQHSWPTLLTIQNALPSELEAITGLAAAGDWRAVRARLANQVRPLESLALALVERVDREAAAEQAEALVNMRSVQRRAFVVVPMTAISLCVLTLLAMLWTVYQIRVRALERRQVEVRALNEQLVKAQEAERMRIAGDLHDGVLQQITSLTLKLGMVKRQVPPDSEAKATLSGLQQKLIQIGADIRHLSHELHPALLQNAGLPTALSSYCEEFSKVRGLPASCETDESVKDLSRCVSTASLRRRSAMPPNIRRQRKLKFGLRDPTVAFAFLCPMMALVVHPTRSGNREGWG